MTALLDPSGPHVRAVTWRDADRRLVAEVTTTAGQAVTRVYGAATFLDERVRRAVLRRLGRAPASVQWFDLRHVDDGQRATGRHEDVETVEVPAVWHVARPNRDEVVAYLLALAERVEAQGVDDFRVAVAPSGDVEARLSW